MSVRVRFLVFAALGIASCAPASSVSIGRDPARDVSIPHPTPLPPSTREGAPMHEGRGDHLAMHLDGGRVLVMGGGPKSVEIYDADRDSWSSWDRLPAGLGFVAGAKIDDDHAWVLLSSFEPMRYEISSKTYVPIAPLPFTACATAFSRLPSGEILAVGGQDCARPAETIANVAVYDPTRDAWTARTPLNHARSFATVSVHDGAIQVDGGGETSERWDPRREVWVDVESQVTADPHPGAILVDLGDGRTVLTGGLEGCGRTCLHALPDTIVYFAGRS